MSDFGKETLTLFISTSVFIIYLKIGIFLCICIKAMVNIAGDNMNS